MHKQRGNHFYHRKNADPEYPFFYQIRILQKTIGSIQKGLRKEKPGNNAACQHQRIGIAGSSSSSKPKLKNHNLNHNCNDRLHKSPKDPKIGSRILRLKIIPGQLPDHLSAIQQFFHRVHLQLLCTKSICRIFPLPNICILHSTYSS